MIKYVLIFTVFVSLISQNVIFNIIQDGDSIGKFDINRFYSKDTLIIHIQATMTFSYFFMSHDYNQNAIWKITPTSFDYSMASKVNSKESWVKLQNSKDGYLFQRESFLSSDEFLIDSISSDLFENLFFEMPLKNESLFASNYGKIFNLISIGNRTFEFETDKNKWILFYNESGQLSKAEFKGFIDYILVNNSSSNRKSHDDQ